MRTHFLNKLSIAGREKVLALEPEFDFYKAGEVSSLTIDFRTSEFPSISMTLDYTAEGRRFQLMMQLDGVRELVLPKMTPFLFLPELEIEDVKGRMMEGIRFEVVSHFERSFICACEDIVVLEFRPLSGGTPIPG